MRRILLATTAIVALSAASPAFAFNNALLFGQVGNNNHAVIDQGDQGPGAPYSSIWQGSNPVLDNGNTMVGGSVGDNNQNDFHQHSARYSNNNGFALQTGNNNKAILNQTTSQGSAGTYGCNGALAGTFCAPTFTKPGMITYTPGSTVYTNDSSTTQIGDRNSVSTTQATTGSSGVKGNNKSTVLQTGFFNGAKVNQKGGSTQKTTQTGILQQANTTQDGNNNGSTTNQHGPVLGLGGLQYSSVTQTGNNNGQGTDQNGFLQASVVSQNGNNNGAGTLQHGSAQAAVTLQNGNNNGASTLQNGEGNLAVTAQTGSSNTSSTNQSGGVNVSGVGQAGSNNSASVTQSGGTNWSAVGQIGSGNSVTVTQSTNP